MTDVVGHQTFYYSQNGAIGEHELPGYLVKWGQKMFTFFDEREEMEEWFQRVKEDCLRRKQPFMPLEVVYQAQPCVFFADIECYTPPGMHTHELDELKADIIRDVTKAYDSRGLDSTALMWSEHHRADKVPSTSSGEM